MDEIKLANGQVYGCSYLATDGQGMLWLILDGLDVSESAAILSDPDLTETMEWSDYRLVGYTELKFIMVEPYGVKCGLKGGHDERK